MVFLFFSKKYKEPLLGLFCVGVLITVHGYVNDHGTRNADYDAMLTLFTTGYCLSFFLFLDNDKRKWLYATFAFITLAALTKGVQAFLFLPAFFVYAFYKKKVISILKQRSFYIGVVCCLLVVVGYYVLRERATPGYVMAVWDNELGGRAGKVIEGHYGTPWFYLDFLVKSYFHEWYVFVIPGILVGAFSKQKWLKELTVFSFVLVLCYIIIISSAQTKVPWYLTPMYPFLAVLVGIFIHGTYSVLYKNEYWKEIMSFNILPVFFVIVVFIAPYLHMVDKVLSPQMDAVQTKEEHDFSMFLKELTSNKKNLTQYHILNASMQQNFHWYYRVLFYEHRPLIFIDTTQLQTGMVMIPYGNGYNKYLEENFHASLIWQQSSVCVYKL